MKERELKKRLKAKGAFFYRHGADHDIWKARSGKRIPVPRHRDVNESVAMGILKQADE